VGRLVLSQRADGSSASRPGGAMRHMRAGTIASIGLEADRCTRRTDSSTSSMARVSTSAASSIACIAATTCTECSPKRSTVESNPAGDESRELRVTTLVRSMLRQMKPRRVSGHPLGPPHPGRTIGNTKNLIPRRRPASLPKTLHSIIPVAKPVYNFGGIGRPPRRRGMMRRVRRRHFCRGEL